MAFNFSTTNARLDGVLGEPAGNERGRALQDLVDEMLASVKGVTVVDRNVLAGQKEVEFDLLLANDGLPDGLPGFNRDILVECKSSKDPVPARDLEHFAEGARARRLPWSILVALNGITGTTEDLHAAQITVRDFMREGSGVLLLVEHELRGLRSAEHLAVVLERKRSKMMLRLRADTLSAEEVEQLDPNRTSGFVNFLRGPDAIKEAILSARRDSFGLLLERARELPALPIEEAVSRARAALEALDAEVADHKENPDKDVMWRGVHDRVVEAGAAFVALVDDRIEHEEIARILEFEVLHSAPQGLNAHASGDLWCLLTRYYLEQARSESSHARRSSIAAVASLCIDEIVAIDDIDPRDVYDDWDEGHIA